MPQAEMLTDNVMFKSFIHFTFSSDSLSLSLSLSWKLFHQATLIKMSDLSGFGHKHLGWCKYTTNKLYKKGGVVLKHFNVEMLNYIFNVVLFRGQVEWKNVYVQYVFSAFVGATWWKWEFIYHRKPEWEWEMAWGRFRQTQATEFTHEAITREVTTFNAFLHCKRG